MADTSQIEILIADDDPVVRHILGSILEPAGYRLAFVESGVGCIDTIHDRANRNDLPGVVILDVMLQDMSGTDVLCEIRKLDSRKQVRIIMVSANKENDLPETSADVAPDFFLEKPFTADSVLAALRAVQRG